MTDDDSTDPELDQEARERVTPPRKPGALPAAVPRHRVVTIRLTEGEYLCATYGAARDGAPVTKWIQDLVVKAIREMGE